MHKWADLQEDPNSRREVKCSGKHGLEVFLLQFGNEFLGGLVALPQDKGR